MVSTGVFAMRKRNAPALLCPPHSLPATRVPARSGQPEATFSRAGSGPGQVRARKRHGGDPGRMAGLLQEPHQVRAGDRGGHRIDQRVIVERFMLHHGGVEHHTHALLVSLSAANGVTAPGSTPSVSRIWSAEPKEKRPPAPSSRCSDLSSITASSSAVTRNNVPFLSLRN